MEDADGVFSRQKNETTLKNREKANLEDETSEPTKYFLDILNWRSLALLLSKPQNKN